MGIPGRETRSGASVRYTFREGGEYSVKLTVTRGEFANSTVKSVIVPFDDKPTAIPQITVGGQTFEEGPISLKRGEDIEFGSASVDAEGNDDTIVVSWTLNGRTHSSSDMKYLFGEPGLYSVKMVAAKKEQPSLRDEKFLQIEVINQKPEISSVSFSQDEKLGAQRVKVSVEAKDPDGDITQYRFEVLESGQVRVSQVSETPHTTFNLSQFPGEHEYSFRVTVVDDYNAQTREEASESLSVNNVVNNNPPVLKLIPTPGNLGSTETIF